MGFQSVNIYLSLCLNSSELLVSGRCGRFEGGANYLTSSIRYWLIALFWPKSTEGSLHNGGIKPASKTNLNDINAFLCGLLQ
jgi:hypothetical protein